LPETTDNPLRQKTHFASQFKPITPSSPATTNISVSFFQKACINAPVPPHHEGRTRRHETSRWDAVAAMVSAALWRKTTGIGADGQAVWFRYPDAGITLVTTLTRRAGNGGQKARRTRESTEQP
jgi:hypothetical protein